MGKQSKKPSHKCCNLTDRKRTGKCSFTKAARVDVPFHQTVGGRGAHRMARGYFLEAKERLNDDSYIPHPPLKCCN